MKTIVAALLLSMASVCAMADESSHAIDIRTDKIVINTDSLNLPGSTTAYEVLTLLPDLVARSKDFVLDNYTIQINGKSVGSSRDAVLNQIHISDLKCIEVSENSLSTASSLGQGGGISLELRDATPKLKGAVDAEVSSEMNYAGGIRLDKSNGKWNFRAIGTVENYVPRDFHSNGITTPSVAITQRDFSEFASAFIEYHPTSVDLFKLTLSEVYTNSRENDLFEYPDDIASYSKSRTRNTNLFAAVNYEHTFPTTGKLCMELNYRFTPEKYDYHTLEFENSYDHKPNNVYGELKLEQPFFKPTATRYAKMELGLQLNYSQANNLTYGHNLVLTDIENTLDVKESTYFLRPFAKVEAKLNKFQMMGIIDYQHFSYETDVRNLNKDEAYNRCEDVTGQAVVMYAPTNRHMFRLRFVRSINRPSSDQIYPYLFIKPDDQSYIYRLGNIDLKPVRQNAIDLDYCLNLSTSSYHLELKASAEYTHTFDRINTVSVNDTVNSYLNIGKVDVFMGDLGIYFRKGIFSGWFSGNIYHNIEDSEGDDGRSHYTYFNLLLRPVFNIGRGWIVSTCVTYNSTIKQDVSEVGKRCYGSIRIAKRWNHFSAYVYGTQNFVGKEKSIVYGDKEDDCQWSDYMHSSFGAGVRYSF